MRSRNGVPYSAITFKLVPPGRGDSNTHWYVVACDSAGVQISNGGYLGSIGSSSEFAIADDGADHYSIGGYLKYVERNMR